MWKCNINSEFCLADVYCGQLNLLPGSTDVKTLPDYF
jgi:hypothetical protein